MLNTKTKFTITSLVALGLIAFSVVYTLNYYKTSKLPEQELITTLGESSTSTNKASSSFVSTAPITTPASECLNFTVDMEYGDSDSKELKGIATLQKFLQEKGYYANDLPVNGNYDTSTGEAVIKLRRDLEVKYGNPKRELSNYEKYTFGFADRWMLRLETGCNMDLTLRQVFDGMKEDFLNFTPEGPVETKTLIPYFINQDTSKVKDSTMTNNMSLQNTVYVSSAKRYGYIVAQNGDARYITFDGVNFRKLEECSFTAKQSAYEYFILDSLIVCSRNASEYFKYIIDKNLNITEKKEIVKAEYNERGYIEKTSCPDKELVKYFYELCREPRG